MDPWSGHSQARSLETSAGALRLPLQAVTQDGRSRSSNSIGSLEERIRSCKWSSPVSGVAWSSDPVCMWKRTCVAGAVHVDGGVQDHYGREFRVGFISLLTRHKTMEVACHIDIQRDRLRKLTYPETMEVACHIDIQRDRLGKLDSLKTMETMEVACHIDIQRDRLGKLTYPETMEVACHIDIQRDRLRKLTYPETMKVACHIDIQRDRLGKLDSLKTMKVACHIDI
ncbi:hypothetical protein RRG08_020665 [Elysia crispata]|uniref:Uncharacterized protein n=1 Tax=Elysia crispata TaxID=231223 RepID=A0AAE1D9S1_9GAST|nr:hypothetical protein RRG08_020665 [Elysia crispata]